MAKYGEETKRTTVTLPRAVFEALELWADEEGRPTANLASFLIELGVRSKFPHGFPPTTKVLFNESTKETSNDHPK